MRWGELLNLKDGDSLTVLDICQASIVILIAKLDFSLGTFEVSYYDEKSIGETGDLVHLRMNVMAVITSAEDVLGREVENLVLCVDSRYVHSAKVRGALRKDFRSKITRSDIRKLIHDVIGGHLRKYEDSCIIDIINDKYVIDNCLQDVNPIGIESRDLSVDMTVIGMSHQNITRIVRDFEQYRVNIIDFVPRLLGLSTSCLKANLTVLIVEIGSADASFSVVRNGYVLQIGFVPIGSDDVIKGIMKRFMVSFSKAKKMKILLETIVSDDLTSDGSDYDIYGKKVFGNVCNRIELSNVVRQGLRPIFASIKDKVCNMEDIDLVLLSGDDVYTDSIGDIAESEFGVSSEIWQFSDDISLLNKDVSFVFRAASCIGVVRYILQKYNRCSMYGRNNNSNWLLAKLTCFLDAIF